MSEPTDDWPRLNEPTGVIERETLVGAQPPPPPQWAAPPPPDRRIGAGMLLGLAVLVLAAGGLVVAWYLTHDRARSTVRTVVSTVPATATAAAPRVMVPRVVGLKEQQALVRLADVGLHPREVYRQTPKPTGTVVSQRPAAAARVGKDATVLIVVDGGAPKVTMPDVTGGSYAAARSRLDALGLTASRTDVTSTKPAGTVVDQAPKAGATLTRGGNVTLSVARPATAAGSGAATTAATTATTTTTTAAAPPQPTTATVPDVSGKNEAAAVQSFWNAGVIPSLVWVPAGDALGTVEAQAKAAGTSVPYRAHVQINLSRGQGSAPLEQVPQLQGRTLKEAVAAANTAGLRLLYLRFPVSDRAGAGQIVQQTPGPGSRAPRNAQVLVFLGVYRG